MGFYNKIKWVLGILIIFVLIVTTNLIDKNSFERVKDSVVSIYEDRLIAKGLILDISNALHQKEVALIASDSVFFDRQNSIANGNIAEAILRFQRTKLTTDESQVFSNLQQDFAALKKIEEESPTLKHRDKLIAQIALLKNDLGTLSEIQLREGNKQMSISKKAMDTVELFTQIEIYLLVFIAIVIQIIIMYQPKKEAS
ncbi:chemotaxis protein [Aquimarina brevivitae]|uniref:Chemoreceptor-like protein with four helix bundle sensory module n=1 Tax=Aquimarina brevivitae TaxID=323412 RepID=A0A4Q7P3J4_9FLAO|nr:chemotaxis protein [Aquimarina brevivitae]RZS93958.1 hypothetical protein EV197_2539 [Aquimarina brevivitae]